MKLSIIIPVYNEERFVKTVINKIKSVELPKGMDRELIIIDDGSEDGTFQMLKGFIDDPMTKIFHRDVNEGKTSAISLGLKFSTGDIIIIQDADLEYNPDYYARLIEPILLDKASVVYGSRFKGKIEGMNIINRISNIFSNITLNFLFHTDISDVNTCYKVFKKEALDNIKLESKRFGFETEVTAKLLKRGYSIYEVPIEYTGRLKKEGKKISLLTGLEMYLGIIKYKFKAKD
ncbi:MAG: glycosyltransferase family 2 protein [Candidatus Omnitrophota bacterium]|jgi:glycosyltransferase involved in cell wall biosynthesis